ELLGEVAGSEVHRLVDLPEQRLLLTAAHTPLREEAARMERASGRPADQARRLARNRPQPLFLGRELRQAVHQPDRVGMPRIAEDRADVADLDDLAGVHD